MTPHVRILHASEADVLQHVAADVFDHPIDPDLAAEFLADARHHIAVAIDGATVVGMASAVDYVHPDKPVQLWINEVGVADAYQRQGIGRRLLEALLEHGRSLGCREAWVGTEQDNEVARRLYETVGGLGAPATVYTFPLDKDPG